MAGKPLSRARRQALEQADAAPVTKSAIAELRGMIPTTARADLTRIFTMRDLVDLCRSETRSAVETLIEVYKNPENAAMVRLAAINILLDRGYGRPHQSVAVATTTTQAAMDYSKLDEADIEALGRIMVKAVPVPSGTGQD